MFFIAKNLLVFLLAAAIVCCGLPRPLSASQTLERGAETADGAAKLRAESLDESPAPAAIPLSDAVAAGEPVLAFGALNAYADPDTAEFEFPEDDRKNLVRDISMWVIASAFVAFFIIKVFIEEDDPEPEDAGPPGKQI